mmetsp:Transcript_8694/g.15525  ORF Transcript_8694/g.15525 Transcript_8694/m.15525 type:complete len:204 (-) Transcript_8694:306-917(-)
MAAEIEVRRHFSAITAGDHLCFGDYGPGIRSCECVERIGSPEGRAPVAARQHDLLGRTPLLIFAFAPRFLAIAHQFEIFPAKLTQDRVRSMTQRFDSMDLSQVKLQLRDMLASIQTDIQQHVSVTEACRVVEPVLSAHHNETGLCEKRLKCERELRHRQKNARCAADVDDATRIAVVVSIHLFFYPLSPLKRSAVIRATHALH